MAERARRAGPGRPPGGRDRAGGGRAVRVAVRVVAPLALALAACTADPAARPAPAAPPPVTATPPPVTATPPPVTRPPGTPPPATPPTTATDGDASFVTPSGNIACEVTVEYTECSIAERRWQPPASAPRCGAQRVIVEIWDGAVRFRCGLTDAETSGSVLAYGRSVTVGTVRCASARTGVTCRTRGGLGFTIGRAGYRVYD